MLNVCAQCAVLYQRGGCLPNIVDVLCRVCKCLSLHCRCDVCARMCVCVCVCVYVLASQVGDQPVYSGLQHSRHR